MLVIGTCSQLYVGQLKRLDDQTGINKCLRVFAKKMFDLSLLFKLLRVLKNFNLNSGVQPKKV